MNNNVYDLIAEFYGNSSGWEEWLSQQYAETFLRLEAYRGGSEADLYESWSAVVTLLVYCGNVYIKIGDMRTDDFTDCIAWCSRNIGDFEPGYDSVSKLLSVWSRLLHFLKQRHAITDDTYADKCRALILDDEHHRLLIQEKDGSIREDLLPHRLQPDTDLNSKVFIDMDNYLEDLLDAMEQYYRHPAFRPELDTATAYCFGLSYEFRDFKHVEGTKEEDAFWEYFFFDYHLLSNGQRPVEHFAAQYQPAPGEDPGGSKPSRIRWKVSCQPVSFCFGKSARIRKITAGTTAKIFSPGIFCTCPCPLMTNLTRRTFFSLVTPWITETWCFPICGG
jgi:hypothetical protein